MLFGVGAVLRSAYPTIRKSVLGGLQTGSPIGLELAGSAIVFAAYAREAEKHAHKLLKRHNTHGEWFRCPIEDIEDAIEKAAKKSIRLYKAQPKSVNPPKPKPLRGPDPFIEGLKKLRAAR